MHPPAPANKSGLKAVSEEPEKHEDNNRPSEGDFNMTVDHVQVRKIGQKSCVNSHQQHRPKWHRQCSIAKEHRDKKNTRAVKKAQRWNELLDDNCQENRHRHGEPANRQSHWAPTTTNTSSTAERSTAGSTMACPSRGRA